MGFPIAAVRRGMEEVVQACSILPWPLNTILLDGGTGTFSHLDLAEGLEAALWGHG